MSFISLKDIHKTYDAGYQALRGVDLEIEQGDFVAMMGPSGSGKSTMANILGCLDSPSSGTYIFNGVDVTKLSRKQKVMLRRFYIGFIFQGFNLLSRTSALENVELPLLYRGVDKHVRHAKAMQALEMVGLDKWAHHSSNELSGGQQQRVAIARAIASEPMFLIADEPTGNLDSKRSVEIMQLLQSLNSDFHITILMVTHESEMADFAKRELHFLDGKIQIDKPKGANIASDSRTGAESSLADSSLAESHLADSNSADSSLDSGALESPALDSAPLDSAIESNPTHARNP